MMNVIKNRVDELQSKMNAVMDQVSKTTDEETLNALRAECVEIKARLFELTNFVPAVSDDKDAILKHFAVRLGPSHGMLKGGLMSNPEKFAVNIDEINRMIAVLKG